MTEFIISVVCIAVVFAVVLVFVIVAYNELVRLKNKVENSMAQVDTQLQRRTEILVALSEKPSGVNANIHFSKLQEEFSEIEEKIAFLRQFYNDAVTIYNNKLHTFPRNLVAVMFGFKEEMLLNLDE